MNWVVLGVIVRFRHWPERGILLADLVPLVWIPCCVAEGSSHRTYALGLNASRDPGRRGPQEAWPTWLGRRFEWPRNATLRRPKNRTSLQAFRRSTTWSWRTSTALASVMSAHLAKYPLGTPWRCPAQDEDRGGADPAALVILDLQLRIDPVADFGFHLAEESWRKSTRCFGRQASQACAVALGSALCFDRLCKDARTAKSAQIVTYLLAWRRARGGLRKFFRIAFGGASIPWRLTAVLHVS